MNAERVRRREREQLDRAVLTLIARGATASPDESEFDELALALFRHQHAHCPAYRSLCDAMGTEARDVRCWRDVQSVPTGAFKRARLASFPARQEVKAFRTSGSTTELRGTLRLDTLALYEASLLETFRANLLPDRERIRLLVLAPSAAAVPDSSLSHMFAVAIRELGAGESEFLIEEDRLRVDHTLRVLETASAPVALAGTAFAFVHLLDELARRELRLRLPSGSRAMETGGFKGRSRELSRGELHAGIEAALGIPAARIVNQYGMCELGTQFYEPSLRHAVATEVKAVPPWARTRVVDPASGRDVPPGTRGVLVHYDLANTGSVLAIATSDAGIECDGGFRVLGRIPGAEARGCSIAADALLAGASAD